MSWNGVIGQERVKEALGRAIDRNRVAHAYLFHGPDGSGKRAAALCLAQALQCETPASAPCGTCSACVRASRLVHPDVQWMLPQPSDVSSEDVRARLERVASEPYATVDFMRRASLDDPGSGSNRQVQYAVGRVSEELRRSMSFRPVEGGYKVAVVTDAELLRREAANAFLKLLEEPTPRTVFILTTSRPDRLLPTILSRCQRIRFERLSEEQIEAALVERRSLEAGMAAAIARMADGSYSRALDLAASEALMASRQTVVSFLRNAYQAWTHGDSLANEIEQLARTGREHLKFQLALMLGWTRDLVIYRTMGPGAAIVNVDQEEAIGNFVARLPDADPAVMADLIEGAIDLIERNVQSRLVLTVLAQRLSEAMRGKGDGRLYVPLSDA